MFSINQDLNKMRLTKGDDATFLLTVLGADGKPINLEGCELMMSVAKTWDSAPSFSCTGDSEGYFSIEHSQTANLNCGLYVFDIQLTTAEGKINTVLKGEFEITEEITQ